MHTLTWMHTRKKIQMSRKVPSIGQAWVIILTVRTIFPRHAFAIDGISV